MYWNAISHCAIKCSVWGRLFWGLWSLLETLDLLLDGVQPSWEAKGLELPFMEIPKLEHIFYTHYVTLGQNFSSGCSFGFDWFGLALIRPNMSLKAKIQQNPWFWLHFLFWFGLVLDVFKYLSQAVIKVQSRPKMSKSQFLDYIWFYFCFWWG